MLFIHSDFFDLSIADKFDGIITDIPYKRAFKGHLHEEDFDFRLFFDKVNNMTLDDAFLITFSNEKCLFDLRLYCERSGWKYHTMLVWHKPGIHNPHGWSLPLYSCEYILFFYKGRGKEFFNFQKGIKRAKYARKKSLHTVKESSNPYSYPAYQSVIECKFPSGWKRVKFPDGRNFKPEKPPGFSWLFFNIICGQKFEPKTGKPIPRFKQANQIKVLDPFTGTGNLLMAFENAIGVDISAEQIIEKIDGKTIKVHIDFPIIDSEIKQTDYSPEPELDEEEIAMETSTKKSVKSKQKIPQSSLKDFCDFKSEQ